MAPSRLVLALLFVAPVFATAFIGCPSASLARHSRVSRSSVGTSMMAKPVQLPTEESFAVFEEAVLKRELPVMVYFHANWCGPCIMQGPVMDRVATDYDGKIEVVKVDCDPHKILMNKYRIRGLPLTGIFIGGKVIAKHEGYLDYDGQLAFMKKQIPGIE